MNSELINWSKKIGILLWFLVLGYIFYISRWIISLLVIAGFITFLIVPLVEKWKKYKIPEWLTIIFVYCVLLIIFIITVWTLLPIIITYISKGITAITQWAQSAQTVYQNEGIAGFHLHPYIEQTISHIIQPENIGNILKFIQENSNSIQSFLTSQVSHVTAGSVSIIWSVGWALTQIVFIGIASFFMVLERKNIAILFLDILPKDGWLYLKRHFTQMQKVCNSWIKATMLLSLTIFTMTYLWLTLINWIFWFGIESVMSLAIISGIMEFIPYIGPILALVPALIIGIGTSWDAALVILILYLIIQQLEGNIFVPLIMSRNLDISPLFVFVIMLFGGAIGGILGIIVAIPIAGVIKIFYSDFHAKRKTRFRYGIDYDKKNPPKKSNNTAQRKRQRQKQG